MRVLHITPSYFPAFKYGGPIEAVHLLNKALAKKGIDVDVFTTDTGLENGKSIPRDEWQELDGIRVRYFRCYGYERYTFSPKIFLELLKDTRFYDLVHITSVWNFPVLAGGIASLLHKKPYILSPHGSIYPEAIGIKSKNKKMFYYNLIAKYYIKRASAIHFTTQDEKENAIGFLDIRNKAFVVPIGFDLSGFEELPRRGSFKNRYAALKNRKYILFLGRINIKKGLDILVESFGEIAKAYKDLYLVIVGANEGNEGFKEEVKRRLKDVGLLERTIFTGMLRERDKLEAFVDAEVFVLPSYSENFGMAVVEAMACGIPVVISNKVGIHREVERNRGGIIVETNPDSLSRGIRALLDNEELKREVRTNGRKMVEEYYDIDKVADMVIKVYREIIRPG
ncbi:MAG TPA: glycosyltransferase [Thermodesulfobacteriota bacterium]|nr:glycosyltransferase [Thermodesulfobacteriota bacterium]